MKISTFLYKHMLSEMQPIGEHAYDLNRCLKEPMLYSVGQIEGARTKEFHSFAVLIRND